MWVHFRRAVAMGSGDVVWADSNRIDRVAQHYAPSQLIRTAACTRGSITSLLSGRRRRVDEHVVSIRADGDQVCCVVEPRRGKHLNAQGAVVVLRTREDGAVGQAVLFNTAEDGSKTDGGCNDEAHVVAAARDQTAGGDWSVEGRAPRLVDGGRVTFEIGLVYRDEAVLIPKGGVAEPVAVQDVHAQEASLKKRKLWVVRSQRGRGELPSGRILIVESKSVAAKFGVGYNRRLNGGVAFNAPQLERGEQQRFELEALNWVEGLGVATFFKIRREDIDSKTGRGGTRKI
eukprot:CAMPEP_0196657942 /NCGR_PEP_ID=MMETSP1086-20130531/26413_1 /TAXON_ID=77921 /ORGANISM="Cyanoptyche  gloeocystis , Strain SAG4.97" /LENGTH=287 /DNA_ID=CAMNT_0041991267 /DNA_START=144 /DNA_END=1007 /DNA_ORIENTATION=-